jgi:hypothetical protein
MRTGNKNLAFFRQLNLRLISASLQLVLVLSTSKSIMNFASSIE